MELLEVVAEVVPLKQGLKPCNVLNVNLNIKGCRGSSIKTRIETKCSKISRNADYMVAEVVPLKQGLKPQ